MAQFLACYDYGAGGVWLYVSAESAAQVIERYPALVVVDTVPPWWNAEIDQQMRSKVGDAWWDDWLSKLPGSRDLS